MWKVEWKDDSTASLVMRLTIINTKSEPNKIVIQPKRGYLFWIELTTGAGTVINRSILDGTNIRALFKHPSVRAPYAITVDYDMRKIGYIA